MTAVERERGTRREISGKKRKRGESRERRVTNSLSTDYALSELDFYARFT